MTNSEKAMMYDECVRESDILQRKNSKLKSEYATNVPPEIEKLIKENDVIIITAGTQHNVINTSSTQPLKFYTLYSPPHHKDKTIHKTKIDADNDTEDHL